MLALLSTVRNLREPRDSCAHRGVALDIWNGAAMSEREARYIRYWHTSARPPLRSSFRIIAA